MLPRLVAFKRKKQNKIEFGHLVFDKNYSGGARIHPLKSEEWISISMIKWLTKL